MTKLFSLSITVAFIFVYPTSVAAQAFPSVWALEGSGQPSLMRDGKLGSPKMRDRLLPGDVLKTDKNSAVRLVYNSGTAVILSNDTNIEILPLQGEIPFIKLNSGTLEAIVEKNMWVPGKPSPKLFLATKNAFIAAGGTDFIADGGSTTEIHALTGSVDLCASNDDFKQRKGEAVGAGQMAVSSEKGISNPQPFDQKAYWKAFAHVRQLLVKIRSPRN